MSEAGSQADRDPARLAAAIEPATRCLAVVEEMLVGPFFRGERLSLADLHAAPMLTCLALAPTGRRLLAAQPGVSAWFARMAERRSMVATRFPSEGRGEPPRSAAQSGTSGGSGQTPP